MGILDETKHALSCPACGTEESARVVDKGSNYGGPYWQRGATFANFETTWNGGGKKEPELVTAVCKRCGAEANRR